MYRYLYLILLSTLLSATIYGQGRAKKKFINGYVVNIYGDTLRGRIKNTREFVNKIRFISDQDSSERVIKISLMEIKSMKINIMHFEKLNYKGRDQLFEKVAYGKYDLFAFKYLHTEIPENRYLLNTDEGLVQISELNFEDITRKYLFDCPMIRSQVFEQKAGYDNIVSLFRQYNRWWESNAPK